MFLRTQRRHGLSRGRTRPQTLPQRGVGFGGGRGRGAVGHGVQAAVLTLLGIGEEVVLCLHLVRKAPKIEAKSEAKIDVNRNIKLQKIYDLCMYMHVYIYI